MPVLITGKNLTARSIMHEKLGSVHTLYGFSTYGTGGSGGLQGDKILVGRFPVERGVGAFIVVEELIAGQGGLDRVDAQGAVVASPELDAGTAVGTFHTAVVLGTLRRQHMQRERQGLEELGQEALCVAGGGPRVDARDHELRHRAHGAELLDGVAVLHIGHVVDLHQLARGVCKEFCVCEPYHEQIKRREVWQRSTTMEYHASYWMS